MNLVKPEFGLIFWMTVTFLIVFFLMKKFAWGPILKMIQEREESIASYQEQKAPMFAPQQPRGPPPKSPGMYGGVPGANAQRKMYNPEFGGMPSMKGALKGGISHGYQTLGMANEEDEITMLMPPEIVPHNAPWEAYKTMDNLSS